MHAAETWVVYEQPHGGTFIETPEKDNIAHIPPHWTLTPQERMRRAKLIAASPKLARLVASMLGMIEAAEPRNPTAWGKVARDVLAEAGIELPLP